MILKNFIRDIHPAHFAMVMATGIISLALKAMGYEHIAAVLFILNMAVYVFLISLLTLQAFLFWPNVRTNLKTPRRACTFLTFVIGTNTLGTQLIAFLHAPVAAIGLWILAFAAWIFCLYFISLIPVVAKTRPIEEIIDGSTLLIAVSFESIALLGIRLLTACSIQNDTALFALWLFWIAGLASYFLIMPLVMYRLLFRPLKPADWGGPYWICMGAAAIITLTGSEIFLSLPMTASWGDIRAATGLLTFFTWMIATSCIPFLIVMDIWKHTKINLPGPPPLWIRFFPWARLGFGRRGKTHFFEPPSWGRVFPMGMYTACTLDLAAVTGLGLLQTIPHYWIWYALAIWALTLVGAIRAVSPTPTESAQAPCINAIHKS